MAYLDGYGYRAGRHRRMPASWFVSDLESFTDPARPLYHGELMDYPDGITDTADPFSEIAGAEEYRWALGNGEDAEPTDYIAEADIPLYEAVVRVYDHNEKWMHAHSLIVDGVIGVMQLDEDDIQTAKLLGFFGGDLRQSAFYPETRPIAVKRLAAILPATRGTNAGKVGITEQAARHYLNAPEDMTAEHVKAIIDATGVSLEYLRGQVLEPTESSERGGVQGVAAIYNRLAEDGKRTLWSVAVALLRSEQHMH